MKNEFPDWVALTPEMAAEKLPRLVEEAESAISKIENSEAATYESFVWALDDATRELWHLWGEVMHMLSVRNNEAWRKLEEDFQPKLVAFSLRVSQSEAIYKKSKALTQRETNPTRKRILEKMCEGAELAGVALEGEKKARFNEICARLAQLSTEFSNSVLDATKAFKLEKDGKTYTIDDAAYLQSMKHCADREVREALYRARTTRSPDNTPRIAEILSLRKEMSSLLGFSDYAHLSIASKCAPDVKEVYAMFDELDAATKEISEKEDALLGENPAPWDMSYEAERLREKQYSYSEEELKKYFEFNETLAGLFRISKFLFGIDVEELEGEEKPSVWHETVRVFAIKDNGETKANLYIDPYVRPGEKRGGAWMNEFRNRSVRNGEIISLPLSVIVLNNTVPGEDGKCYMPMREVETLFHEFGHSLQCMLTEVDEEDAAGINLVEWDAVEVASQFMENWCLDERTLIKLPPELKAKVEAAKNFRAASACRRQLGLSKADMDIHAEGGIPEGESANDVKNRVFKHFGMNILEDDLFLNAFTHIFAGGYAAGYYGYKWSEVMSADCYGAFEDAGLKDDEAMKRVGRKYRSTILALGGSESAWDVFIRFRGRKPTSQALLRQQGLLSH